jgi:hypothetical protein
MFRPPRNANDDEWERMQAEEDWEEEEEEDEDEEQEAAPEQPAANGTQASQHVPSAEGPVEAQATNTVEHANEDPEQSSSSIQDLHSALSDSKSGIQRPEATVLAKLARLQRAQNLIPS